MTNRRCCCFQRRRTRRRTILTVGLALASVTVVWQFQIGVELSRYVFPAVSSSSLSSSNNNNNTILVVDHRAHENVTVTSGSNDSDTTTSYHKNNNNNNKTVWWPHSLVQDKTLEWDPKVHRPWLDPNAPPPPAVILLTSFGWNHVNQQWALTIPRSIRETELLTGVINHPWFHPTLWNELDQVYPKRPQQGRKRRRQEQQQQQPAGSNRTLLATTINNNSTTRLPPQTRIYIFLDQPQCGESNYPIYGGGGEQNMDVTFGRRLLGGGTRRTRHTGTTPLEQPMNPLWSSPTFEKLRLASFPTTAILLDCTGDGLGGGRNPQIRTTGSLSNASYLSIATLSSLISHVKEDRDQGLIPPMPRPSHLTRQQVHDIQTCAAETNRPFYFVYAGNFRSGANADFHRRHGGGARRSYQHLNDNQRIFVSRYFLAAEFNRSALSQYSYPQFMARAVFALAARGDNKFSYRFSEVLSAGTIPVVHADDWVWPFRPELVNWTECAVILPEKDAGRTTLAYLDTISLEQRCRMRQACYRIYKDYVETPVGTVNGLVQGLELVQTHQQQGGRSSLKLQGVRCDEFVNASRDCNLQR